MSTAVADEKFDVKEIPEQKTQEEQRAEQDQQKKAVLDSLLSDVSAARKAADASQLGVLQQGEDAKEQAGDGTDETTKSDAIPSDNQKSDEKADVAEAKDPGQKMPDKERNADLVKLAKAQGWSDSDIASFSDDKSLQAAIDIYERRVMAKADKDDAQPEQKEGDQKKADTTDQKKTPETVQIPELKIDLDPDEVGEEVVNTVKSIQQHYDAKFDALVSELKVVLEPMLKRSNEVSQIVGSLQQETAYRAAQRFNQMVNSLGPDYAELLGTGPTEALSVESDHYKNRIELNKKMQKLAKVESEDNPNYRPDVMTLGPRVARYAFGDKVKAKSGSVKADQESDKGPTMEDMIEPHTSTASSGSTRNVKEKRVKEELAAAVKKARGS